VRETRSLRAMWRALETEPRQFLNGHEEGNLGYKPRRSLRATAPALDPTRAVDATGIGPIDLIAGGNCAEHPERRSGSWRRGPIAIRRLVRGARGRVQTLYIWCCFRAIPEIQKLVNQ
jgi:hypothetical protein